MSSLGEQWRVLRHYLSRSTLADVDKRLRRLKPDHWDHLVKRFEQAISIRMTQEANDVEVSKNKSLKSVTAQQTATAALAENQAGRTPPSTPESKDPGLSVGSEAKEITFQGLLQGLRLKKDLHFGKISEPGWKDHKPIVTKSSIHSRTAYVISALARGAGPACQAKRAADFIHHVTQYPEARDLAIKEGAVRVLLRVQDRLRDDSPDAKEVNGIINEALALVGWLPPVRGPGPAVLALDGGGIRGLIAIEVLRHLERLTGRPVQRLFDFIVGVSTGAIIAAVIGGGVGDLETASKMYHTLSKEMFGNTSVIGGTSRLVWSHSYYDTAAWERMLRDNLGDLMLSHCNRKDNPKMALVSCAAAGPSSRLAPFVFRTYSCGYRVRGAVRGTSRAPVWHAVRASAAAPAYFEEYHREGLVHHDGGLAVNNPAGVGLHEARLLWGGAALARGTLLSLGTGQAPAPAPTPASPARTSWRDKFNTILDSATDTEGVHMMLNDLLPDGSYFRFNPPLMEPCAMDEIDPRRIQNMLTDTHAYIRRNQHKFEQAARRLTRARPLPARAADALHRRAVLCGLASPH